MLIPRRYDGNAQASDYLTATFRNLNLLSSDHD